MSGGQADPVAFRVLEMGQDHPGSDLRGSPDPLASELLGLRQIARHVIHLHIDDQPRVARPFLVLRGRVCRESPSDYAIAVALARDT